MFKFQFSMIFFFKSSYPKYCNLNFTPRVEDGRWVVHLLWSVVAAPNRYLTETIFASNENYVAVFGLDFGSLKSYFNEIGLNFKSVFGLVFSTYSGLCPNII